MLKVNVAVTFALELRRKLAGEEVPVHASDHPEKIELASGVAVRVTRVPGLKVVPTGLMITVPLPVPALEIVRVYCNTPDWVTVKVFPPKVKVPVLEERFVLGKTE